MKIGSVIMEIQEYLFSHLSDEQIAKKVGCPVEWVHQERESFICGYDETSDYPYEQ